MSERLTLTAWIVICVLFAPWWIGAMTAIAGIFLFSEYYEVLILGALYDLLYAPGGGIFTSMEGTLYALIVFCAGQFLRYNLNLHEKQFIRGRRNIS